MKTKLNHRGRAEIDYTEEELFLIDYHRIKLQALECELRDLNREWKTLLQSDPSTVGSTALVVLEKTNNLRWCRRLIRRALRHRQRMYAEAVNTPFEVRAAAITVGLFEAILGRTNEAGET